MFDPLGTLRQIRSDKTLTANQKLVLMAAVLRTDNKTGSVVASQAMLAEDTGLSLSTVKRVYSTLDTPLVRTEKVGPRRTDLRWLRVSERHPEGVSVTPLLPISTTCNTDTHITTSSTSKDRMIEDQFEAQILDLRTRLGVL